jgi:hypothetical protein
MYYSLTFLSHTRVDREQRKEKASYPFKRVARRKGPGLVSPLSPRARHAAHDR